MPKGVNKVILIGNLGSDPEVRSNPNGTYIATVSLATNDSWQDKQTGEWQERTEWHRLVFFSRQAEIAGQYLRKGSQIYVEGRLQTRKWQDQSGLDRYTTEIIVREMQMLGSRSDNATTTYTAPSTGGYTAAPPPPPMEGMGSTPPSPPPVQNTPPHPAPTSSPSADRSFDDDVPF